MFKFIPKNKQTTKNMNCISIPSEVLLLGGYGEGNPDNIQEYNAIVWLEGGGCIYSHKGNIVDGEWVPLDEEKITDISDFLSGNSILSVENDGTVTAVNEYEYDVPNVIEYFTSHSCDEIIAGKIIVGDLEGVAARADSDKDGNNIVKTYAKKNETDIILDKKINKVDAITKDKIDGICRGELEYSWAQSPATTGKFRASRKVKDLWVACGGDTNGLWYSLDGKLWNQSNITNIEFWDVCDVGDLYVAAGSEGLYYSNNGKYWLKSNITSDCFVSLCYANSTCVAVGSNGAYYSNNGVHWSKTSVDFSSSTVLYANGVWVLGASAGTTKRLYYSTDGITWTESSLTDTRPFVINDLYYANGLWVAAGSAGIHYSTDGKEWTLATDSPKTGYSVYFADGVWVAAGGSASAPGLYYSTDGMTWQSTNITTATYTGVHKAGDMWVAIGYATGVCYSMDGITWTQTEWTQTEIAATKFYSINYADGIFVTSSNTGLFYFVPLDGAYLDTKGLAHLWSNILAIFGSDDSSLQNLLQNLLTALNCSYDSSTNTVTFS